jgi:hypothetical protein
MKLAICELLSLYILGAQSYFVILSSIDLSSRMNVGRVTRERSAPGRNCAMMCESTTAVLNMFGSKHKSKALTISLFWLNHSGVLVDRFSLVLRGGAIA